MKKTSPEQFRLAAEIIEKNLEWEYTVPDGVIGFSPSASEPHSARLGFSLQHGYEIRIKPPQEKWAAEKAAFARGEKVQVGDGHGNWLDLIPNPTWEADEYRIKPWSLTRHIEGFRPLADNEAWHRSDWEKEMLPAGWRPLLDGERYEAGCAEILMNDGWETVNHSAYVVKDNVTRLRTTRPMPPPKKIVPLGPDDVPPGSVFRDNDPTRPQDRKTWTSPAAVLDDGVFLVMRVGSLRKAPWVELMKNQQIKRPSEEWLPCSKTVDAMP